MKCQGTAGGTPLDVKVTVTKVDGSNVNFDIEATQSN
jgi:predicted thioesterase